MKQENIILKKSFNFSVRIVNLYKHISSKQKEYVLSKQLLRSGTSIGANINEAQAGQSKKDFISKMSIASKEANETRYWIELLVATKYLDENDKHVKSLLLEINEIIKLLTSIIKTTKTNNE